MDSYLIPEKEICLYVKPVTIRVGLAAINESISEPCTSKSRAAPVDGILRKILLDVKPKQVSLEWLNQLWRYRETTLLSATRSWIVI